VRADDIAVQGRMPVEELAEDGHPFLQGCGA